MCCQGVGDSATELFAVGDSGLILYTQDGGSTWTSQNSGTTADLLSVAFSEDDNTTGIAVGRNGVVRFTQTGGMVWVGLSIPGTTNGAPPGDVFFFSSFAVVRFTHLVVSCHDWWRALDLQ